MCFIVYFIFVFFVNKEIDLFVMFWFESIFWGVLYYGDKVVDDKLLIDWIDKEGKWWIW